MKLKIILLLTLSLSLQAVNFSKKATVEPLLVQKGEAKYWCPVCGMSIKQYYKTSYIAQLQNGTKRQYCSLRCLVTDMKEYGLKKGSIKVVDVTSQKYIDVSKAFFVVKSKVNGTMSRISKLAFKEKKDALKFMKKYKGKLVDFDTALKMAQNSLEKDDIVTKRKKEKKVYQKGKKIYTIACEHTVDPTDYIEINDLKADIVSKHICKKLKPKQLQAVALYLWEVKRFGDLNSIKNRVVVSEDEKCPVCGMFTYKYPRWAAQIFYKHNGHTHHLSFDGVKDLMKFYFDPMKWGAYGEVNKNSITKILVTDYYTQKAIDGTKAFYVIHSNIYGPMGHEFIPFENLEDAKTFKRDHFGTDILKFDQIEPTNPYRLDSF